MPILLFDTAFHSRLFPLTLNKSQADLRMGVLTFKERWRLISGQPVFVGTKKYLQPLYEPIAANEYLIIDVSIFPDHELFDQILDLPSGKGLKDDYGLIAFKITLSNIEALHGSFEQLLDQATLIPPVCRVVRLQQLFQWNDEAIRFDIKLLTQNKVSQAIPDFVQVAGKEQVFIAPGAQIHHSFINATTGPVYIGADAIVMEGCAIRGPFAMGEGAVLKMGAKVYGATTIGPFCTAGGEIKNSIISGYSNKAHDGYLGDSVIGEWCNLGAGATNSNVKNTGGEVMLYDYETGHYQSAGNKCGVIMGDYSRAAINTSINTGTVIGLCCNVFGNGLTPKFIPDFSWGFDEWKTYHFDKAITDISNWKKMKQAVNSPEQLQVLRHLFDEIIGLKRV